MTEQERFRDKVARLETFIDVASNIIYYLSQIQGRWDAMEKQERLPDEDTCRKLSEDLDLVCDGLAEQEDVAENILDYLYKFRRQKEKESQG